MRMQDALAARAEAAPLPGAADAGPLANGIAAQPSGLPDNAQAMIHCPAPSVMSAGRQRAAEWILEFEPRARPFIEPLMGWTGSTDPLRQVRLRFPNCEAAISYARRHRLQYEVREPTHIRHGDLARAQRNTPTAEDPVPPEIGWMWDRPELVFERLVAANEGGARAA